MKVTDSVQHKEGIAVTASSYASEQEEILRPFCFCVGLGRVNSDELSKYILKTCNVKGNILNTMRERKINKTSSSSNKLK